MIDEFVDFKTEEHNGKYILYVMQNNSIWLYFVLHIVFVCASLGRCLKEWLDIWQILSRKHPKRPNIPLSDEGRVKCAPLRVFKCVYQQDFFVKTYKSVKFRFIQYCQEIALTVS